MAIFVNLLPGAAALIALIFTWQSVSQTYANLNLSEEGQITDRYTAAVVNLGEKSEALRLGGVYALQRIMQDSPRDQPAIVNVLSSFVRSNAQADSWTVPGTWAIKCDPVSLPREVESSTPPPQPAADVRAAIDVLVSRDRGRDRGVKVDLRFADLRGVELRDQNLSGFLLSGADLRSARIAYADLREADLLRARLDEADLTGANLQGSVLQGADLQGSELSGADLSGSHLAGANFAHAEMSEARLVKAAPGPLNADVGDLAPNFSCASLEKANLSESEMGGVWRSAILLKANLIGADLSGSDFTGACLAEANLSKAQLRYAVFSKAKTAGVNFSGAYHAHARDFPSREQNEAPAVGQIPC
ncbi:pentapeptide repeat-containing protein [Streptomyces yerevanensis]|uniref:pentapeptide repeat-containing protein n=1 Tax=Streptomyces yerevanensis TaxID=66378 RepID=UPI00147078FB|nr:pentapeptide repeat-containing protein [Streptomyces yerevanensis]